MKNNKCKKSAAFAIAVLSMILFIKLENLYAADVAPPVIMLTSYSISGNMLTDKIISLRLNLANTSQNRDVNDVLISYSSANNIFLPAYGISNQFFIPSIPAGKSVDQDLLISVNDPLPNDILYFNFDVTFSDAVNGTNTNSFFISDSVRNANVIQLIGMEAIAINGIEGDRRIITFKSTVINHSNFLVKKATMILEGKNPDFSVSVPLDEISPGNFLISEFHLTLLSDYIPKFNVKFNYVDINGASYFSDPQRITVYLNNLFADGNLETVDAQVQSIFRKVGLLLFFVFSAIVAVIFFARLRKKKGF